MAEGKNKIVFYADWKDSFNHLTDEEAGKLIKHFFKYVNDENPTLEDRLLKASWIPIEKTLKRDLKKWESYVEKQKENGKKGGRPKTQKTQAFLEKPKKAVNDSVSDSVTDINNIYKKFVDEVKNHAFDERIESLYMNLKIRKGTLTELLKEYHNHLISENRLHKDTNEFFINFKNWLNVQDRIGKLKKHKH